MQTTVKKDEQCSFSRARSHEELEHEFLESGVLIGRHLLVLVQIFGDETSDHFLGADLPGNVGWYNFAPKSLREPLGPVRWTKTGWVVHVRVPEVLWSSFNAKRRKKDELTDVLRVQTRVRAHQIATERVGSQEEVGQIHLDAPILHHSDKEVVCVCVCLVRKGSPAACAHANDVEHDNSEVVGETLE